MAKNTSMTLGDHFETFVDQMVAAGRYGNASEVLRAGLRLLEENETRLQALRQAIDEGLGSGPRERFDVETFLAERARETSRG